MLRQVRVLWDLTQRNLRALCKETEALNMGGALCERMIWKLKLSELHGESSRGRKIEKMRLPRILVSTTAMPLT